MTVRTSQTLPARVVSLDPEKSLVEAIRLMQEWSPDQPIPNITDDSWLRSTELPATTWCVPGRIPWGMWHCSAPPGGYKSALFDQIAHHIAYGIPVPGTNWQTDRHGSVLVVSPDETAAEAQARSLIIAEGGSLPGDGAPFTADRAIVRVSIPDGHNAEQRIMWLWRTISEMESGAYDGRKHDVVMIVWDTVGHLLGAADGVNAYEHADALKELNHRMANEKRLLAVTNHEGKDGRHIGSVGLVANANLFTTITPEKNAGCGEIAAEKLRGAQRWTLSVKFDDGLVCFDDHLPQEIRHGHSTVPAKIVALLRKLGRATARQIRDALGIDRRQIWTVIRRLWRAGEIIRDAELQWSLADMGQAPLELVPPAVVDPITPAASEPEPAQDAPVATGVPAEPARPAPAHTTPRAVAGEAEDWYADTSLERAIPAVMELFDITRTLGRYPIVKHPKIPTPLVKPGKSKPHLVWEGRPTWANPKITEGTLIQRLDKPGAYLAALRTDLPIGGLQPYDGDVIPNGMAGIHLITWPRWRHPDLPHPGGQRTDTTSKVWVSTPTLVLFDRLTVAGRMDPVKVHEQYLAKATENLLAKLQDRIKRARDRALALGAGDGEPGHALYEFQKACYSRLVSTLGDSGANWEIRRPDWQVIIRAQSYANLWRRADEAHKAGLIVARVANTDELHIAGDSDWRTVFDEGRGLRQFTAKATYSWSASDARRARR